ncbi:MAG: O-antigen ligase family protein [Nitrospiraceae bacterium]|nr:O-antigen ligase family protein [Nitrospiraceae bacterium]
MKNIQIISNKLGTNNSSPVIIWIDRTILFCFSILVFVLPIAHTATIRYLALYIPVALLILRYYLAKDFIWIKTSFELPLFLFFIVAIASLPTSVDFHESLDQIWGELLVPILLFYATYFALRKGTDGLLLLKIFFLSSFLFSLYSFYDFYRHDGTWPFITYRAGGLRDPGGGEVAGLYHTMVIPFLFWGIFYFKKIWQHIGLSIILVINFLALQITFTRAAVLALGVQTVLIIGLLLSEKRWLWSLIILIFAISVSFLYIENKMFREMHTHKIPTLKEYMTLTPKEIAGPSPTSMEQRLAMWKTAIDKLSKNPFYPHGYGRFLFGKTVRTDKNKHFTYPQTHNTFIGIAFELGIQGLIIFLWMIGTFLWVCWNYWRNAMDDRTSYMSASLLTMMVGYWVDNFFGSFDGDDSKLLFMMLLGIGMAVMHRIPKERELSNLR